MIIEALSLLALTLVIVAVVAWVLKEKKEENQPRLDPIGRMRMQEDGEEELEERLPNRKDAAKIAKKEEKKKQTAARLAAIEDKNKRLEEKQQEWLKREEAAELKEREAELQQKLIEEEKLKKEEEEYNKWKDLLEVESKGEEIQEETFTLDSFLDYIKVRKVVMIEDLASAFNLDGKTVINRLQQLENSGHLTGILDDRGKYIFVTGEEFLAFKKYVEARGRVTRIELCNEGNRLIRMNPTAEDFVKIEAEDRKNSENN